MNSIQSEGYSNFRVCSVERITSVHKSSNQSERETALIAMLLI